MNVHFGSRFRVKCDNIRGFNINGLIDYLQLNYNVVNAMAQEQQVNVTRDNQVYADAAPRCNTPNVVGVSGATAAEFICKDAWDERVLKAIDTFVRNHVDKLGSSHIRKIDSPPITEDRVLFDVSRAAESRFGMLNYWVTHVGVTRAQFKDFEEDLP